MKTETVQLPSEIRRMTPRKLLSRLIKLRDSLMQGGPSQEWALRFLWMNIVLRFYKMRPQYEEHKDSLPLRIQFLDTAEPFTERDLQTIKQAAAVKREIQKHLRELRKFGRDST